MPACLGEVRACVRLRRTVGEHLPPDVLADVREGVQLHQERALSRPGQGTGGEVGSINVLHQSAIISISACLDLQPLQPSTPHSHDRTATQPSHPLPLLRHAFVRLYLPTLSCVLAFSTSSGVTSCAMRTRLAMSTREKSGSFSGGTTA